jgi:protein O-mannosyl-transferase
MGKISVNSDRSFTLTVSIFLADMKRAITKRATTAVKETPHLSGKQSAAASLLYRWSGTAAVHLVIIAVIGLLAYSNTFHAPFVFDDESSIIENPSIKNLTAFLFEGAGYRYNPRRFIGYLTIALNYRFGGLDVTGYHIFNLTVHILVAWLVYALARLTMQTPFFVTREPGTGTPSPESRIPNSRFLPLLAALLFVAHPVQTQAVTYVVQRLASLAAMFYLSSLVLYAQARLRQEATGTFRDGRVCLFYLLSLLAAILAMKTKEIAFTLPLIVCLYEFSFFGATLRKRLLFLLAPALTLLIVPFGLIHKGKPIGEFLSDVSEMARESHIISRGDYLLTQFRVIMTYLRLLVLPVNQNLDYDYPVYDSPLTPGVLLSFLFLAALFALSLYLYRRSGRDEQGEIADVQGRSPFNGPELRLIAFGIIWFFVTLSVESSVIPITDVIFEHRLYLPSVGLICAVASLAVLVARRYSSRAWPLVWGIVIVALAFATWQRNLVWGSATGIWRDCIAKSPQKVRPYNNLANALTAQGRVDEAIEQLGIALKQEPDNASALRNRGAAFEKKGLLDEAIEQYRLALSVSPGDAVAHYNLGVAYNKKGFTDMAIEQFLFAIKLDANYSDAYNNLGVAYGNKGLLDEAIEQLRAALKLNPGSFDAHNNLGFALGKKGSMAEALAELSVAVKLRPNDAEAYNNLGIVYGMQKAYGQAVEQFQKAIALQPDNQKYSYNLANAYRLKLQGN